MKTPDKIYLQVENDDEITWCDDRIEDSDVAYVKESETQKTITALKEDAERLAAKHLNYDGVWRCNHCGNVIGVNLSGHAEDCPIRLHNELMKKLEVK